MATVPVALQSQSVAPPVQLGSPQLQDSLDLRGPLAQEESQAHLELQD